MTKGEIAVQSSWKAETAYLIATPTSWYDWGPQSKRFNLNAPPEVLVIEPVNTAQYSTGDTVTIQWKYTNGCASAATLFAKLTRPPHFSISPSALVDVYVYISKSMLPDTQVFAQTGVVLSSGSLSFTILSTEESAYYYVYIGWPSGQGDILGNYPNYANGPYVRACLLSSSL